MKIKMFKKLIAVLCAAAMSMSAISSVGAVQFSGPNPMEQKHKDALTSVNDSIEDTLTHLQDIEKLYADNRKLTKIEKVKYISLISSIADKLNNLNKQDVLSRSFLIDTLKPRLADISHVIVRLLIDAEDNVSSITNQINAEGTLSSITNQINSEIDDLSNKLKESNNKVKNNNMNIIINNNNNFNNISMININNMGMRNNINIIKIDNMGIRNNNNMGMMNNNVNNNINNNMNIIINNNNINNNNFNNITMININNMGMRSNINIIKINNMGMNNMGMNNNNMINNINSNMNYNNSNMNYNNSNMNYNNSNMNYNNSMNNNNSNMNYNNSMNNNNSNMNYNNSMNNMGMNNMETQWKSLSANEKKNQLNEILSDNGINIQITQDDYNWNHLSVQGFIDNATYDDVLKLPSFIKALIGKTFNRYGDVLCYRDGKLCFWNNEKQCAQGLMPLLGALYSNAINNPQIFDTIPNRLQYSHLIEILKKC